MAKYVIDTELNNRALSSGIRGINQQMNSLTRSAREFNKEFEKSGKKSDKKKAVQDMAQAISLADEKVKKLTADLEAMEAKGNIKGINKAEADLRNAKTQAAALRREMEAMNKSAGGGVTGFARLKAAKDAAMNSKPVKALSASFKGLSAVASGSATVIKTGFNGIAKAAQFGIGTLAKISGTAAAGLGLLGKSAMGTYDEITRGNRAMTNSLSDGAKGANEFQGEIKKLGSAGLADMGSLTDIAKNLSSSLNLSGKEAFKMSTNILDIGTAFGMSKDKIENFGLVSSQIFSAGKLMAQDYNQLIDSGAAGPIKKWIAAHNDAGITMDNFKEKVNNGEVSADLYRKAIESLGADFKGAGQDVQTFGDAFENSMKSLDMSFIESMKKEFGSLGFTLSDMSDNMSDFTTQIGEAAAAFLGGAWQAVSPFVSELSSGFDGLSFSVGEIARMIGVDLFTAIGNLIPNMSELQVYSDLLSGAWNFLMSLITQITSLMGTFIDAFMKAAGWIGETGGATEKVNEDWAILQGLIGPLAAALQPLIEFLGQTAGQLFQGAMQALAFMEKSGLLKDVLDLLGGIIETVVNTVKNLISHFIKSSGLMDENSGAGKHLKGIMEGLKKIWDDIGPTIERVGGKIGDVIGKIFEIIGAVLDWITNSGLLEWAIKSLLDWIELFVDMASRWLDTIKGIAKGIGDAWNAIFKSADDQQKEDEFTYNVSTNVEDEPDPFAGLGDIQYFTKASGVMDALNSAMGSFRGATMASKTTGATTYGDFNVSIDGAQNPQAIMTEFKGLMRKNGYPLKYK